MAPHIAMVTLFYLLAFASIIDAAPIHLHGMTKRNGAALKVVKRDSEEALSPLARLLKGLKSTSDRDDSTQQFVKNDVAAENDSPSALASQLGQDINDVVRLVMASPVAPSASSAAENSAAPSPMIDINAMESAYAQGIENLPAPSSASKSAAAASSSVMVDVQAMEDAYLQGISGLAKRDNDVDIAAMQEAYQQGIANLPQPSSASASASESASASGSFFGSAPARAKRSNIQIENQLQTPVPASVLEASRLSGASAPAPTQTLVDVDGVLMPLDAFPTITEYLIPTAVVEPSGSGASALPYTRLGYQAQMGEADDNSTPMSAIAMEEAHSAPASIRRPSSASHSAQQPSHSAVAFASDAAASDQEAQQENDPVAHQAHYVPIPHGF